MLISASRRTDIPAFYSEWLVDRIDAGYCLVRNPMNAAQVRRISLSPLDVDGMVLWTKNAAPLLPRLAALDPFPYYFQYTVTPYGADVETGLANKRDVVIPAFLELSKVIGKGRVIWRYDPIIITTRYDCPYHIRAFTRLCALLAPGTDRCVISFVNEYKSVARNLREIGHAAPGLEDKLRLTQTLRTIASGNGVELCACCESPEVYELGVRPAACVDAGLMGRIAGRPLTIPRDRNQRAGCCCSQSVDIGAYDSCVNGCRYCYANHGDARARANYARHDPRAEMLIV